MNRLFQSLLTTIFACALLAFALSATTKLPFAQDAQPTPAAATDSAAVSEDTQATSLVDTATLTAAESLSDSAAMTATKAQLSSVIALYESEQYTDALALLQEVQIAFAEEDDRQGEGVAWLYLGYLYQATDESEKALDAWERSALIWEQLSDHIQLLRTLQVIGDYHYHAENLEQAATTYRTALTLADELGNDEIAAALTLQLNQIDFDQNFEQYQRDLDVARQASQGEKAASLLKKIGALYQGINDNEQAIATYEEELSFRRQLRQLDKIADALKAIGRIHENQQQYSAAAAVYQEAATIWQELKETDKAASLYKDLGTAYRKAESYDQAAEAYREELALRRLLNDAQGEVEAYHNISEALLAAGANEEAIPALQSEIDGWLALDNREKASGAQIKLAQLYAAQPDVTEALLQYATAISLTRTISDEKTLATLLVDLADLQVTSGDLDAAGEHYAEALTLWQRLDKTSDTLKVLRRLGDLYRDNESPAQAIPYLEQAISLAKADEDDKTLAKIYEDLGASYRATANIAKSVAAYEAALARWQALEDQESIMDTFKVLGDLAYRETQDYIAALDYFEKAQAIAMAEGWTADEADLVRRVGDSYDKQKAFESALASYQQSLALWQQAGDTAEAAKVAQDITQAEADLAEQLLALRTENGLVEPADGATVSGLVDIRGLASDEMFQKWQLDLLINQDSARATFLDVSRRAAPAVKRLMTLDTTNYPNGTHTLRLRVVRTDFNYDEYTVTITIAN